MNRSRPLRGKRVTLIVAVPCKDGFVMAADSQETITEWDDSARDYVQFRKTVQKIPAIEMGEFSVIIAGSGNTDLIESFIVVLKRRFINEKADRIDDFVAITESTLEDFHNRKVKEATCQDLAMFFAAVPKKQGEMGVWRQMHTTLVPITAPEMIGCNEAIYVDALARTCTKDMTPLQGILAALHVLSIAENTSNSVKGPMHVAMITPNVIWTENEKYIRAMTENLKIFEREIGRVFIACADTSIHASQLEKTLHEFSAFAVHMHKTIIDETVNIMGIDGMFNSAAPFARYPRGSIIGLTGNGTLEFEHDPNKLKTELTRIKQVMRGWSTKDENVEENQ
jgi:hypothetical protein